MDHEKMTATIDEIVARHSDRKPIVAILQDIQEEYRYLPKEALVYLAAKINVSLAKIYSVATFYENFSLEPKGKYVIKICDGTACHVRKSIPILTRSETVSIFQMTRRLRTTDSLPLKRFHVSEHADLLL